MRDVLATPVFESVANLLTQYGPRLVEAEMVHITGPATLEGVLAIGQLEAACLDVGVKYRRRFFTPRHHLPRDADEAWEVSSSGLTVVLDAEASTWEVGDLQEQAHVHVVPLATTVELGSAQRRLGGAVDTVAQAAAIAASLAPNGRRVRKLRPFISLGLWLRAGLDTNMDPIHTLLVNHLRDEGTLRVVPLPEVSNPAVEMMPGLSQRQLNRLRRAWPTMDVEQRSMALSELILPCLTEPELSTPRLEALAWHRMVVGDGEKDLVSQLHEVKKAWPSDADAGRVFGSTLLDTWLQTGELSVPAQATD
tara:strand:- start:6818 stop:7741 length:924 start_codon:yes stop_codon:yes gene_type:complete